LLGKSERGWYFRQLPPGFHSFDVLQSRPVVVALPPSKVPGLVGAGAATASERTLTGTVNARLTDSCLNVTTGSTDKCYALPADPGNLKSLLSICGDGDRCHVTGRFNEATSTLEAISKAEPVTP
jgi:hypothetical protein